MFVRENRQDDQRDEHELHDRPEIGVFETPGERMHLRLQVEQHCECAADDDRHGHWAGREECTQGEHHKHRHFGGEAAVRLLMLEVAHEEHGGHGDQAGGDNPAAKRAGKTAAEEAENGDQRKSAKTAQGRTAPLPLQSDDQPEPQRDAQPLQQNSDVPVFHLKGMYRRERELGIGLRASATG